MVGTPAVRARSLIENGMPWSGRARRPSSRPARPRAAASVARSAVTVQKALSFGLRRSMRSSTARVSSTGESFLCTDESAPARSRACSRGRSASWRGCYHEATTPLTLALSPRRGEGILVPRALPRGGRESWTLARSPEGRGKETPLTLALSPRRGEGILVPRALPRGGRESWTLARSPEGRGKETPLTLTLSPRRGEGNLGERESGRERNWYTGLRVSKSYPHSSGAAWCDGHDGR